MHRFVLSTTNFSCLVEAIRFHDLVAMQTRGKVDKCFNAQDTGISKANTTQLLAQEYCYGRPREHQHFALGPSRGCAYLRS